MSNLPEKIQSAINELRQLQEEMKASAAAKVEPIDTAALREFKVVIDYVRQLVWNYIRADSAHSGLNVDE